MRAAVTHLFKEVVLPNGGDNLPDDRSVFHLQAGCKVYRNVSTGHSCMQMVVTYCTA